MREYCALYFIALFICCVCNQTRVIRRRSDKSQQTFVVRYKNGEQTIPVTVVLDDKKQTEYVINMSPRTPEKSVTLYDFKQRTIAYKDLTNRECFLGRLTDETLKHEIDALSEVRNPIESDPKMLSLDPHRSALTPTEIRNIAGQKTAVFCRKMNTWLIMPQGSHTIRKREVDDEFEERTYNRHGFHTVRYSHYGHETRRRYRKPRPTSPPLTHEEERPLEEQNQRSGLMVSNSTSENNVSTELPSYFDERSMNLERNFDGNIPSHHASSLLPETDFKHNSYSNIVENDLNSKNSDTNSSNHSKNRNNLPYRNSVDNLNPNTYDHLLNRDNSKNEHSTDWDTSPNSPVFRTSTSKLHNENAFLRNEFDENDNVYYPPSNRLRNIETEVYPTDLAEDSPRRKHFLSVDLSDDHTENPDVSINVLEIPKISTKFENLDRFEPHQTLLQPNEDVHTIFEGFYNLRETFPSPSSEHKHNPRSRNSQFPQNKENDRGDRFKMLNPLISPLQESVSLDDAYRGHTLPPLTPFTELPTVASDYVTTNMPYLKNRHDFLVNKSSSILHRNNNHEGSANKVSSAVPFISSNQSLSKTHLNFKKHNSASDRQVKIDYNSNFQPSLPVPVATIQEGTAPNHLRFQNILQQYRPDEIVIDIEKIPTERPPDSTSGFGERIFPPNRIRNPFLNVTSSNGNVKSEHISSVHSRSNHLQNVSNARRRNNIQKHIQTGITFHTRRDPHHLDEFRKFSSSPPSNNLHHINQPLRQNFPAFFNQLPRMDTLPPGVSLHPRHPQAPYANMLHTNMLQTVPQRNSHRLLKLHRQRHHRKKDRGSNTCCRGNGVTSPCCSGHSRRTMKSSCCPQFQQSENVKHLRQDSTVLPRSSNFQPQIVLIKSPLPLQVTPRSDTDLPISGTKTFNDKGDRCLKEKMCRTLYESTQQVMVCRNANIEGC